ncbi:MAG TPA: glycosyltransferase, partial [Chloroflexota bacterium]|nr:glycosyltransferase [Chloroflexota bacterium]
EVINSAGIRMDHSAAPWDLWLGETTWPTSPVEVFGASGGACLLRREMLDDIGLFDEGCFAYLEDVDLAWRAQLRGWKTMLAPEAVVYHAMSATAGEGSPFKRYRLAKNKWRTIIRCYPSPQLLQNLPIILAYDNLSIANSIAHGDMVPLHGRLDAFKELPALLQQRKAIQNRRTASWSDIERVLSPLESPFTLRRRARLASRLASTRTDAQR